MKIIAIPFAGGNRYSFKKLEKYVSSPIQWVTIELPGRGARFNEPILEDITTMVKDLFEQIKPHIEQETYMIYGHSMGTLLGYELTKMLIQKQCKLPECLFFSGRGAPKTAKFKGKSSLPKEEFWKEVEEMGGLPRPKSRRSAASRAIAPQCPAGQRMNRLKLLGDRIMSRYPDRQTAEVQIRIAIMNRCSALGRAEIEAVA